jgi:hypothetical protein
MALHHSELAQTMMDGAAEDWSRSRTWVAKVATKCQLVLRAGEDLELDREEWGRTGVVRTWFDHHGQDVNDVPERLRLNGDEVGAAVNYLGKWICIPGCRLFKLRGTKLPHLTVFSVFNCFADSPPLFVVVPKLKSVKNRFRAIYGQQLYLTQIWSGWVTGDVLEEWAEWVCEWLEGYRSIHDLEGRPAVLFLDNASTRNHADAMQGFREHNVRVILLPPHLTCVVQPVDVCWA